MKLSQLEKIRVAGLALVFTGAAVGALFVAGRANTAFRESPTPSSPVAEGTAVPAEEIPEMADILGTDQTARLNAARRLAERVGIEEALEILEASALPHTGEGHLAVHQVGFYAYQEYGTEAILHCKDYFLYACYHGAIIEAASDQGLTTVAQMADTCKGSPSRYFQCAHAVGHALLAMWDYDLPEALADCDHIFEKEEAAFPGALSSCHNGAFMENLFGVHDWGTDETPQRNWLSTDPYFPCTAVGEKYQQGCWLNQASRIYTLMGGDVARTRSACEKAGNPQRVAWCMDNLARQIHPLTAGDVDKVYELCRQVGPTWQEKCVVVNAGSYYSVGDAETAIGVCRGALSPLAKTDCYNVVVGQLIPDTNRDRTSKETLCRSLEEGYQAACLTQVGQ
jgi:hypothetical protein